MTDEYRQAISCSHSDGKVLGQSCFVPGSKIGAMKRKMCRCFCVHSEHKRILNRETKMGKSMSVHVASADPRRREESEAIILEGTTQQPEQPETHSASI